jgi:YD repeat-containing protein
MWTRVVCQLASRVRVVQVPSHRAWLIVCVAVLAAMVSAGSAAASPPTTAIRYFYDRAGQLKAIYSPSSETGIYGWDPAGNLTSLAVQPSTKLSVIQVAPAQAAVGETVTIQGTGFSTTASSDIVHFHETLASVTTATATSLTVKVPTGATSGTVTVSTPSEGPIGSPQSFTVAASAVPHISSLSSTIAEAETTVTINGTNFESGLINNVVTINQTRAEIISATTTAIQVKVPGATTGGHVFVATPKGSYTGPDLYITPLGYTPTQVGAKTRFTEGGAFTTKLTKAGQIGLAIFDGAAGQNLSLVASLSTIESQYIVVYSPNGTRLTEQFIGGENGMVEPVPLRTTGTYTVIIQPTGAHFGSVKLTSYLVQDVTGSLTPTTAGASQSATLTTPGQNARYTVGGTAGEKVAVETTSSAFGGGLYFLEWLNPNGSQLAGLGSFGGNLFMEQVTFPSTGSYTLVVNPNGSVTGSTKLTAYETPDVTGTITPTTEGEAKSFTTSIPGQRVRVAFEGTTGQTILVALTESTIAGGSLQIDNPEGASVGEFLFGTGGGPSREVTLAATGTYTIIMRPHEGDTGKIQMKATLLSSGHARGPFAQRSLSTPGMQLLAPVGAVDLPGNATTTGHSRGTLSKRSLDNHRGARHTSRTDQFGSGNVMPNVLRAATKDFQPSGPTTWIPSRAARGDGWRTGREASPWRELAELSAGGAATALAGQALTLNGLPLGNLSVSIEGTRATAKTDATGRFLLSGLPPGHHVLVVDGLSRAGHERYGTFEVGVNIVAHQTTSLGFTLWMSPLDRTGNHQIASPTTGATTITTPLIPGLEVRLPSGTVIHDAAGRVVRKLNITPVPVDRPPFPLPSFLAVPLYFTIQPGRAYLSKGAQIVYPNYTHLPAGQRVDFWNYDADKQGWYVYGKGTVTPDGSKVIPDPGVRVWEFTGSMITGTPEPPGSGPKPGASSKSGDPVDLQTGLFVYHKVDLELPDTIPIVIDHTYRQGDPNSYSFGIGTASLYDLRLWSVNNYHEADLVLPDGGRVHYVRTSPGTGVEEAEYQPTSTIQPYYGSILKWSTPDGGWDLTLVDGTTYVFGNDAPIKAIRNRNGQQLTIAHASGDAGHITQVSSPHGLWVKYKYDENNRVTQITDDTGRTVKYVYSSGRLESVTDAAERTTSYEYDSSNNLTGVTDGRGKKYVATAYDANDRVAKQTLGDTGVYSFEYSLSGGGKVESTTVTDPLSNQRKVTFNEAGFPVSDTEGLGTASQQTTTYERQPETDLILSTTDPLGRETAYKYDSSGNVSEQTLLAGTGAAQTTTYKYEPGTNELTTETDPLKHTNTYQYGPSGELLSATDPLGHQTTFKYNSEGEVAEITNALKKTTTFTYEAGTLSVVTDPLGHKTKQFINGAGCVASTTAPGGLATFYEYGADDELTKIVDPLGNSTSYKYDADGNLTSVTDPRNNTTKATYDPMDRLESITDPLERTTTMVHDKDGNVTQLADRRGKISTYAYDPLNRLTLASYGVLGGSSESTIKYSYDNGNRPTGIIDSATGTYIPTYDELDRLESLATPTGTVKYTYDAANRRATMTAPGQEPIKYTYDEADRLTGITRASQKASFTYDAANEQTKTTLLDGIEEQYTYDAGGEPTLIAYKKGTTTLGEIDYSYETNGHVEATWGSYARTGIPTAIASATYDAANEQTTVNGTALAYDANGDLTSDGSATYSWDARGQLASITAGETAKYEYDPFGRLATRSVGSSTTHLLYDGPAVLQEASGAATTNLIPSHGVSTPLARTTSSGTVSYLSDAQTSVIALASSAGTVATSYTYDPFGTTSSAGETSANLSQYHGHEVAYTGLYRSGGGGAIKTGTGRFIAPSGGFLLGGSNSYQYMANEPTETANSESTINWPEPQAPEPDPTSSRDGGAMGAGVDNVGGDPDGPVIPRHPDLPSLGGNTNATRVQLPHPFSGIDAGSKKAKEPEYLRACLVGGGLKLLGNLEAFEGGPLGIAGTFALGCAEEVVPMYLKVQHPNWADAVDEIDAIKGGIEGGKKLYDFGGAAGEFLGRRIY